MSSCRDARLTLAGTLGPGPLISPSTPALQCRSNCRAVAVANSSLVLPCLRTNAHIFIQHNPQEDMSCLMSIMLLDNNRFVAQALALRGLLHRRLHSSEQLLALASPSCNAGLTGTKVN